MTAAEFFSSNMNTTVTIAETLNMYMRGRQKASSCNIKCLCERQNERGSSCNIRRIYERQQDRWYLQRTVLFWVIMQTAAATLDMYTETERQIDRQTAAATLNENMTDRKQIFHSDINNILYCKIQMPTANSGNSLLYRLHEMHKMNINMGSCVQLSTRFLS